MKMKSDVFLLLQTEKYANHASSSQYICQFSFSSVYLYIYISIYLSIYLFNIIYIYLDEWAAPVDCPPWNILLPAPALLPQPLI